MPIVSGGSSGGGSQPELFRYYSNPGNAPTSVGTSGSYLAWVNVNPVNYPGQGTQPLNLAVPTNPVILADGNYEFLIEPECDETHAGKTLSVVMYADLDGVSDGPGETLDLGAAIGFCRTTIPFRRFLAAGTKIGVFGFHDVGSPLPVFLWVQASWELT